MIVLNVILAVIVWLLVGSLVLLLVKRTMDDGYGGTFNYEVDVLDFLVIVPWPLWLVVITVIGFARLVFRLLPTKRPY